ncbi:armadillo-type protein [Pavlovales sp. CCMP2436]|nr:armadillo-type protein [Pavlovales sp. CCMP2436]
MLTLPTLRGAGDSGSGVSLFGSLESQLSVSSTVGRASSSFDGWPLHKLSHGNGMDFAARGDRSDAEQQAPPSLDTSRNSSRNHPSTSGFLLPPSSNRYASNGLPTSDEPGRDWEPGHVPGHVPSHVPSYREPGLVPGYRQFGYANLPGGGLDSECADIPLALDSLTLEPYYPRNSSRSPVGSIGSDRSSLTERSSRADAFASELTWERRDSWERWEESQVHDQGHTHHGESAQWAPLQSLEAPAQQHAADSSYFNCHEHGDVNASIYPLQSESGAAVNRQHWQQQQQQQHPPPPPPPQQQRRQQQQLQQQPFQLQQPHQRQQQIQQLQLQQQPFQLQQPQQQLLHFSLQQQSQQPSPPQPQQLSAAAGMALIPVLVQLPSGIVQTVYMQQPSTGGMHTHGLPIPVTPSCNGFCNDSGQPGFAAAPTGHVAGVASPPALVGRGERARRSHGSERASNFGRDGNSSREPHPGRNGRLRFKPGAQPVGVSGAPSPSGSHREPGSRSGDARANGGGSGSGSGGQHGSRGIQQRLEVASPEERVAAFDEILPHVVRLMLDVFGNYVVQKVAPLPHKLRLVDELSTCVIKCVRDQNGNHVIQKVIECVPANFTIPILGAFEGHALSLAAHSYGCRVMQRVMEHASDAQKATLLKELLPHCGSLCCDQYGNYVMQHVVQLCPPEPRALVTACVVQRALEYSMHKFASNVVEKCLQYSAPEQREALIQKLLGEGETWAVLRRTTYGRHVLHKLESHRTPRGGGGTKHVNYYHVYYNS